MPTMKQRMRAVLAGEGCDRLPWAPRLDLWHQANQRAGTLPPPYAKASLMEICDDLGWGFHAVVPDFRDCRIAEDDADRALGIYNLPMMPYRTVLENVRRSVQVDGDRTHVTYETPQGIVTTTTLYDEAMRRAGITITHIEKHALSDDAGFAALGHIFENARVEPNYDGFAAFQEQVGERFLAVAFISLAASPMHLIQRELMPMEDFFLALYDRPDELAKLAGQIGLYWERLLEVARGCPAEVVFLGANYDATVTYPPFFAEHILPTLKQWAEVLHGAGKYLLTHTDGENNGLLEHYLAAGIDIADSVCPRPMTKLTLKETREAFGGKITIMGGVPSVALLPEAMPEREFAGFIEQFFSDLGGGERLILGVSDTTPPAADFGRLVRIGEMAARFGPVPASGA